MNNLALAAHTLAVMLTRGSLVIALLMISVRCADAQTITDGSTPLALAPGSPADSYSLSDFDTINLYNGNLSFRLPLLKIGRRGSAGTVIMLNLERRAWRVRHLSGPEGTYETHLPESNGVQGSVSHSGGFEGAAQRIWLYNVPAA